MLFSKTKTIIAFSGSELTVSVVDFPNGKPVVRSQTSFPFTWEKLATTLAEIKKKFGADPVRLLLPEEKTYLLLLKLAPGELPSRSLIFAKAQEKIPEIIDENFFDWKKAGGEEQKTVKIQALAVNKEFLAAFLAGAKKANINFEAFESPSFSLARLTKNETEPHLLVYQSGTGTIACASFQGRVYGSLFVADQSQLQDKIKQLSEFVAGQWNLNAKKVINQSLDPVLGLALKEDLKGEDSRVLNLEPKKTS